MKKIMMTLAALPLATIAVEASAQNNVNAGANIQNRIANIETQLYAGVQQGAFDQREARSLRQQVVSLRRLERQYSANGLTQQERSVLQQRIRSVRQQMRSADGRAGYTYAEDNNGTGYGNNAYGNTAYGNRGVTYDQYGRQVQTGGVTYDQYGRQVQTGGVVYDQYGRAVQTGGVVYDQYGRQVVTGNNGYYGQGGPVTSYPQQSNNGGIGNILGGVLGSVVGGGSGAGGVLGNVLGGGGGIGIGSLITGALGSVLGGVPSNYQSQYQNRDNVYFRSDGRQIYEIDARTNQVVRIHPMR